MCAPQAGIAPLATFQRKDRSTAETSRVGDVSAV